MYKTIGLNLLFFFLIGCNQTNPIKEESVVDYSVEVLSAERHGLALYNAMQSVDASEAPTSREQDLLDMASQKILCDGNYSAVRVDDIEDGMEHIYLVLGPSKSEGIQMGRHVRFDFAIGSNDIKEIVLSSNTCLLVPVAEKEAEAAFVTHILSDVPSEFHVYLSLLHKKPIYVGTNVGTWSVKEGKITKVQ